MIEDIDQIQQQCLDRFTTIVGLRLGLGMQQIKRAVSLGNPQIK